MRSHETDAWSALRTHPRFVRKCINEVKAIEARHFDVHRDQVRTVASHGFERFCRVRVSACDFHSLYPREEVTKSTDRQRFILDDTNPHLQASNSSGKVNRQSKSPLSLDEVSSSPRFPKWARRRSLTFRNPTPTPSAGLAASPPRLATTSSS